MAIEPIDQEDYESRGLARDPMITMFTEEVAWYASTKIALLGSVIYDKTDKDWSYVILAPEEGKEYRWIAGNVSIEDQSTAEAQLFLEMLKIEKTGKVVEELYVEEVEPKKKTTALFTNINDELKKYFAKHPDEVYKLASLKFEELIADILKDLGFDVELTKATRDGGRDIIAFIRNAVCSYLTYVECKKYSKTNKVGVGIVRQVAGVHKIRQANKSIIVTTSFFSKDAIKEAKEIKNELELKDYDDIKAWLARYK